MTQFDRLGVERGTARRHAHLHWQVIEVLLRQQHMRRQGRAAPASSWIGTLMAKEDPGNTLTEVIKLPNRGGGRRLSVALSLNRSYEI